MAASSYAHHYNLASRADLWRGSEPLVKLGSLLAIGTELACDKAFDWAMVTAEDLGERIQALAIAMAELVGVEEVDRGAEP